MTSDSQWTRYIMILQADGIYEILLSPGPLGTGVVYCKTLLGKQMIGMGKVCEKSSGWDVTHLLVGIIQAKAWHTSGQNGGISVTLCICS